MIDCLCPELSFVVNLWFYNEGTGGTIAFQESWSGYKVCSLLCQFYNAYESHKYVHQQRKRN